MRGLGDPDLALLGADLRGAAEAADRDIAGEEREAGPRDLVELDRALRAVEDDLAEPSDAPEFGGIGLRLDTGAGGQLDGHLDRSGAHGRDAGAVREYEEVLAAIFTQSGLPR
ncbi:hypothetical protein GCM10010232_17880 [Streptomyces amakusaensis]